MIKSLKITNCQSHAETELNFSDGVNVIVGETDTGKTAIIRNLRWLVRNRPSGNSLRSFWGGETLSKLETEEGIVSRSKDKVDSYTLTLHGHKTYRFKAIGVSVPEEISRFLNIDEVNFQSQLDSHFLLSKTPGEVAQYFNKIAHLEQINKATVNINKAIRDIESNITHKKNDKKTKKIELQKFDYLNKFEAEVEVLEDLESKLIALKQKKIKLENLIIRIKEIKAEMQEQQGLLKMESQVNALLQLYEDKRSLERDKMLLNKAVSTITKVNVLLKDNRARHTRLLALFQKSFPNVCPLCGQPVKNKHI